MKQIKLGLADESIKMLTELKAFFRSPTISNVIRILIEDRWKEIRNQSGK